MSILASKTIAINIVDLQDGRGFTAEAQHDDLNRLALLEAQVKELTQWKRSMSPAIVSSSSGDSDSGSDSDTPSSELSLDTRELLPPPVSTGDAVKITKSTGRGNLPAKKPDTDMTSRILTIIQGYGHNEENAEGEQWLGRNKFEPRVRKHVDNNAPIDLVLPAFPWKSVNKVEKVLGALPDLGEELALGRLQNLCEDIQAIYPPGAYVTVTSDGLVYADLVGISSEEVFEYGLNLRRMAVEKGYDRLKFIRIMNLLGVTDSPHMTKEEYVSCVEESRKMLVEKYLPKGFDARDAILNDPDINLTYCGYIIFLNKDLRYSPVTANVTTKGEYKRTVKRVANDMITRGKAFAAAIDDNFPDYVRLSIHRSTGSNKLSFPLIPQPSHFSMTPWHCCLAVTHKGQFRTAHAIELRETFDVIEQGGRPYYYRDRSDVWKWDVPVEFEIFYPRGIYVRARPAEGEPAPKIGPAELAKIKKLSKGFSPVIPLGFT
ncbi:pyoverdine biosynthesis [Trichoderma arundinaceum]|uniref:Pyoverdine biosynthesis n=1 Tax=Trichoderma arundinaceum TaxID=490622 RepID=A0A395NTC5_TRIAR|nr:pyoverdine biosynthesis [Trichoderma arundinaceum]